MKPVCTAIAFLLLTMPAFAQAKQNALSLELGKTGLIYNLRYDRTTKGGKFGVSGSIGSNFGSYISLFHGGGGPYYLLGKGKSRFETGLELKYLRVMVNSDDQRSIPVYPDFETQAVYPSLNLGYRGLYKKSIFRIGFSPCIIGSELLPGGYLSYGFMF